MRATTNASAGFIDSRGFRPLAQMGVALLAVLLIGLTLPPADAESAPGAGETLSVKPVDAKDVRAVVQAQLDAFAADDAERAFSFAAQGIRDMFGSASNFLQMVRSSYPVVYRPASIAYLAPQWASGTLVQPVQMSDADGKSWLALYTLERDPKGAWRITGCRVEPNEGRAV